MKKTLSPAAFRAAKPDTSKRRRSSIVAAPESRKHQLQTSWATRIVDDSIASAFLDATSMGQLEDCQALLQRCAKDHDDVDKSRCALVNITCSSGESVLMLACHYEYPNIVKLLLKHGADPCFRVTSGTDEWTPLQAAMRTSRPFIIRLVTEAYLRQEYMAKGLFLSARELGSLFKTSAERLVASRVLVDVYASQSAEELTIGITADFLTKPSQTLHDVLKTAASTERKAMRLRAIEPFTADELSASSVRLQLAAAACLHSIGTLKDGLGRFECDEILASPRGRDALMTALRFRCRVFVAQPEVQSFMDREWRGKLLNCTNDASLNLGDRALSAVYFALAWVINITFIPLVAILPQMETILYDGLWALDHQHRRLVQGSNSARRHYFTYLDFFLFRLPCFKFWTRLLTNIVAAVLITSLEVGHANTPGITEADALATTSFHSFMLLWAFAGLMGEIQQAAPSRKSLYNEIKSLYRSDVPSIYRADVFNLADMACWILLLLALALETSQAHIAAAASSLASIASWYRLLRVFTLSSTLGPLVLMFVKMLGDVAKLCVRLTPHSEHTVGAPHHPTLRTPNLRARTHRPHSRSPMARVDALPFPFTRSRSLVIMLFVVFMFTSGIYVLLNANGGGAMADEDLPSECSNFYSMRGRLDRWEHLFFVVVNSALHGDMYTHIPCMMRVLPEHWALIWMYTFTFNILAIVLLLNMLIAMMAKTFDNVWEASEVNHQFLFARLVKSQQTRPPEPAPLTLLRAPVLFLAFALIALAAVIPRTWRIYVCISKARERVLAGFEYSSFLNIAKELEAKQKEHAQTEESESKKASKNAAAGYRQETRVNRHGSESLTKLFFKGSKQAAAANLSLSGEYIGTTFSGRNTFEAWRASWTKADLNDFAADFIASHQDDVAQETRWRSKMVMRIGEMFEQLEKRVNRRFDALADTDGDAKKQLEKQADPGHGAKMLRSYIAMAMSEESKNKSHATSTSVRLSTSESLGFDGQLVQRAVEAEAAPASSMPSWLSA